MTPIRQILVPVDFSEQSRAAFDDAVALAQPFGATVDVIHVWEPPAFVPFGTVLDAETTNASLTKLIEQNAERALAQFVADAAQRGLAVRGSRLESGSPAKCIVEASDGGHYDLIVMGTHGRTGLAHAFLGSVAERVVRYAHCSVLVARPLRKSGCIVAATDLSDPSLPAIAAGADAAKRAGARLVVVSALEWNDGAAAAGGMFGLLPALPSAEVKQELRDALHTTLEAAMAQVGAVGEARVLDGSAATAVVACAEELEAALIVVGTHGRTGLARLALGSVAEHVIRNAGCSVLAVRLADRGRAEKPQ